MIERGTGAVMMRLITAPYAFDPAGGQAAAELMQWSLRQIECSQPIGYEPFANFDGWW
jgi:hypothetical protein